MQPLTTCSWHNTPVLSREGTAIKGVGYYLLETVKKKTKPAEKEQNQKEKIVFSFNIVQPE